MSDLLFQWIIENHMKVNKEHFYMISYKSVPVNRGTEIIHNSGKLLGIKINSKLDFKDHLESICIKSQC